MFVLQERWISFIKTSFTSNVCAIFLFIGLSDKVNLVPPFVHSFFTANNNYYCSCLASLARILFGCSRNLVCFAYLAPSALTVATLSFAILIEL